MVPNNTLGCAGNVVPDSFCSFGSVINNSWILDSGATDHMYCHKYLFDSLHTLEHSVTISLPNGTIASVNQAGNISINLNFSSVMFYTSLPFNLTYCQLASC